jgi:hypothetical protein
MSLRHRLLAIYFVLCALALVWPGYAWLGNRVEPWVLGLPLSFAYNIGWVVLTFAVLVVFHLSGEDERRGP